MRRLVLAVCLMSSGTVTQASVIYTFANTGGGAYSFSFTEPNFLTTPGTFSITPVTVDGFSFTQAALGIFSGPSSYCFVFGTAGANPVSGGTNSCALTANPGEAGTISNFLGTLNAPGVYTTVNESGGGGIPPSQGPNQVTITLTPEPGTFLILTSAIVAMAVLRRRPQI